MGAQVLHLILSRNDCADFYILKVVGTFCSCWENVIA